ncbi:condensation domain-containing protein, partial [Variovorax sp. J22R115]|uniref:condensation domain-containing protein n=1 Tax=Variovorax sp. J22R115 TaxID=3053509 RepID=UPI0025785F64
MTTPRPPFDDLELLDLLLAREQPPGVVPAPAHRRDGEAPPMSRAQRRLWFLQLAAPDSPAYNISSAVRIAGGLDDDALRRAVGELVRRHASLRSGFASLDGRPHVAVRSAADADAALDFEREDLCGLEDDARAARLAAHLSAQARRPFDLATAPLLRVRLLRLAPHDHVALLVLHHIAADGWSIGLLVNELGRLYAAFAAGQPSPLAPPALQYGDFAAWQERWLAGEDAERQRRWWTDRLAGLTPLELPTDRPRPAQPSWRGATCRWSVRAATATALQQIGQRAGATPFMTVLAAFAVLLSRYSGQHDIVIGAPVANRNRREFEPLVGMLVNTLVLRCDLSGRPGFAEVLRRVRDFTAEALAHQDLPFEEVVRAMAPQRDGSGNPLFQVVFTMGGGSDEALELPGLTLSRLEVDSRVAKFDLLLNAAAVGGELHGAFEYACDLFDAATIARMAGHFATLLDGIAADPQADVATLALLTEAERRQLAGWNDSARPYPRDDGLGPLVARQAERTPQAMAVEFGTVR